MSEPGQTTVEQGRDWPRRLISCILFSFRCRPGDLYSACRLARLVPLEKAPNPSIQKVGPPLGQWLTDAARFVLMDTDEKPFPWGSPADHQSLA